MADHPPLPFAAPRAVTTDSFGNIFVASYGSGGSEGKEGRIDIFDSAGFFIGEVKVEGPLQVAIDSKGNLYVVELPPSGTARLSLIPPTQYSPTSGEIAYGAASAVLRTYGGIVSLAVNPANDHLFVNEGPNVTEFSSAEEENKVIDESIGAAELNYQAGVSVAVDTVSNRLYASDFDEGEGVVRVFDLTGSPNLIKTITGAETPANKFGTQPVVAADEGTGGFFIYDGGELGSGKVYEFDKEGKYLATIAYGIKDVGAVVKIWVDNGPNSLNGALHPDGRYLFVPSHPSGVGHVFAYGPSGVCEPSIESLSFQEVTRTDAELIASIDPCGAVTSYTFEYTTQQRFEEEGFENASVAGSGQLPADKVTQSVTAAATGLSSETTYRFRLVAANEVGAKEAEEEFTTYPDAEPVPPCPNDGVRIGLSALLPDCRAYELVTPADTNARTPFGLGNFGIYFGSLEASPAGDRVSFQIEGGTIPGNEGTGSLGGDPYLSTRGPQGWSTASAGPTGAEASAVMPGSTSPDQGYSFWNAEGAGSMVVGGVPTNYVRYPDGHSELVGRGELDTDARAEGKLISENGGHIIFVSGTTSGPAIQLEPNAPPSGTRTIYDRTSDEVTHVVSLLPDDKTPAAGQDPVYAGASLDGEGVAFTLEGVLYLRFDNEETYEIGNAVTFAGIAEGGERIFYLEGGNLKAFDVQAGAISFSTSGDVTPVNVSADGTAAYFVSPSVLTSEANPNGAVAQAGKENLYLSHEGEISFVGTVETEDVQGKLTGLGSWVEAAGTGRFAIDSSRSTPDGSVLLFESRAALAGYDPGERVEVYRYDYLGNELTCLSCNPTGADAVGDASLQSIGTERAAPEPLNPFNRLANLRADGRRAFFQSTEALVLEDIDGLQDVYEWEDRGVGSCTRPLGCIYLISSGHSDRIDYLYAVSDSGDDVFFRSSDLLLPLDADETPSIYDARVGGGFPEPAGSSCPTTQACPNAPTPTPVFTTPGSRAAGEARKPRRCPKGQRKVKRHGKVRCVKKHRKHRAGSEKKGARR